MPHLWQKGRIEEHTNVRVVRWNIVVFCKRPNRSDVLFRGCEVDGFREWKAGRLESALSPSTSRLCSLSLKLVSWFLMWPESNCHASPTVSHCCSHTCFSLNIMAEITVCDVLCDISKAFGLIACRLCFRTDLKMIRTPSVMEKVEIWEEKWVWKSHRN